MQSMLMPQSWNSSCHICSTLRPLEIGGAQTMPSNITTCRLHLSQWQGLARATTRIHWSQRVAGVARLLPTLPSSQARLPSRALGSFRLGKADASQKHHSKHLHVEMYPKSRKRRSPPPNAGRRLCRPVALCQSNLSNRFFSSRTTKKSNINYAKINARDDAPASSFLSRKNGGRGRRERSTIVRE